MDAIHARAQKLVKDATTNASGGELLRLAEAYAWLIAPNQPHGGSVPR
jgi:hypothetical protein